CGVISALCGCSVKQHPARLPLPSGPAEHPPKSASAFQAKGRAGYQAVSYNPSIARSCVLITGAKRGRSRKEEQPGVEGLTAAVAPMRRPATRGLESLEERIDDCLTLARSLDREGLEAVIDLLRRARNGVVVQQGR